MSTSLSRSQKMKNKLDWQFWFAIIGGVMMTLTTYYMGMQKIRDDQSALSEKITDNFYKMDLRLTLIEAKLPVDSANKVSNNASVHKD